jgi:hypothetical protein
LLLSVLGRKGLCDGQRHAPHFFTFRKIASPELRVCDIQWDKYGKPRFAVNFGKCSADDVRGQPLPPVDVFPEHTPERGRLIPGTRFMTSGWFRQDRPLLQRIISWSPLRAPEEVVRELMDLFREVEEYWDKGHVGRHIHIAPNPLPKPAGSQRG